MAERKRVGIIFSYQEKWVAGAYYILNLVHALNTLPDAEKPHITACIENDSDKAHLLDTGYPYLSFEFVGKPRPLPLRVLNKMLSAVTGRHFFPYGLSPGCADAFFPYLPKSELSRIPVEKQIHWIPDFQDSRMPFFFPQHELDLRSKRNNSIAASPVRVVFSSQDAEKDFHTYYPNQQTKNYVVHFAVTHPDTANVSEPEIRKKFQLPEKWLFSPNQFWQHKNHPVIIRALAKLRERNVLPHVVFTGKEDDFRNPGYAGEVKKLALQLGVSEQCHFLGFIDRAEQLWLMKNAEAVIQPSLFEGWSTVVEDAKALQKPVILSDIPVHREQMNRGVVFFDPDSPESLSAAVEHFFQNRASVMPADYHEDVLAFGRNFMKLL
jgi:glycosyltransferase involved in cell wall biosynthesis